MNINEIAKLAQVSRATVSRYLNNGYVSQEKREAIRRVIEETGYRPSSTAQTLRTRKTRLVGVVLPKINSDSVSRMVAGISQVLSEKGYQIVLANTANNLEEELKYLSFFRERHVDGVILVATMFTRRHKELLKEYQVPLVILGQQLSGYPCVYHDDYNASRELTAILARQGREFGYLGVTDRDVAAGLNRRRGFEAGLKESHKRWDPACSREVTFSVEEGRQGMRELLEKNPQLDSVFCATDNIAIGALIYLKEAGKRVPEDIQLVGTGDGLTGRVISPPITTVHFYYKTSGIEAAQMLCEMLETEKPVSREIKMGYEILVRDSVREKRVSQQ